MEDRELSLIDKAVSSLLEVPLSSNVTSLNLHCNRLSRIEGLTSAWHLLHLDLSSNRISRVEGLGSLSSLRTLNLSCNLITKVEGLKGLVNLTRLNLSYNRINSLIGLLDLHGAEYKLKQISLHSNQLDSINHLLQCMLGVQSLREVTLSHEGKSNPVCSLPAYREMVVKSLPQISVLDGLDRQGNMAPAREDSPGDIPGLEDYVDFLFSSETSASELHSKGDGALTTPRIDEVLTQFRQRVDPGVGVDPGTSSAERRLPPPATAERAHERRIETLEQRVSQLFLQPPARAGPAPAEATARRAKRDIDHTSESERGSGEEEDGRRGRGAPRAAAARRACKGSRGARSDSDRENRKPKGSKCAVGSRRVAEAPSSAQSSGPTRRGPLKTTRAPGERITKPTVEEETYRTIVEERDQERERRWKAEQAARALAAQLKSLQSRACEERDLQNMALNTTDRLKELLLKERAGRADAQTRADELEGRCRSLAQQLEAARAGEEQHKRALHHLEDSSTRGEALRARQQAEEVKRWQELENRASALRREADLQRASVRQLKARLQEVHELLASREQEHRKELASRLTPGGEDFRQAVAKEVSSAERGHAQREAELEEKVAAGRNQYAALEEEFRVALTIEAARFSEVKEAYDHLSAEHATRTAALSQSQQKERHSASLVPELTAMVKEQKRHISELTKTKKEAVAQLKGRVRSLEEEAERDRRLVLQLEPLRKDKSRLLSQLSAQESVIDGLRAERKIWGQELALQGASLAQDRGRLEARVEALAAELETRRKQSERDSDTLRIKGKIIDDQTETIRKLKESLQERDEQTRRLREEAAQAQRSFRKQLDEGAAPLAELRERLEGLAQRKEQLKQQLAEKELEMDDLRAAHSASSKTWQEKADLLTRLEGQVKRMKENFDSREGLLLEERDAAVEAQKATVEKLHSVDDAFRRQLESLQASHHAELLRLADDKQKRIEQANQKVIQVEEEMRALLDETQSSKRVLEEKICRLTNVLKDF